MRGNVKKTKKSADSLSSRCLRIVPHVALVTAVVAYLIGGAFIFQRLEFKQNRRSVTKLESDNLLVHHSISDIERFFAFMRMNFPANLTLETATEMEQLLARLQISCIDAVGREEQLPIKETSYHENYDDLIFVTNTTYSNTTSLETVVQPILEISNGMDSAMVRSVQSLNGSDGVDTDDASSIESIDLETWDHLLSGILFAFTAVSTIGYGHLYPITTEGRLFCIFYTLFGIPLFMITVADIGKFIWEGFWSLLLCLRRRLRCCRSNTTVDEEMEEAPLFITAPLLLIAFVGYIGLGAFLLPQWEDLQWVDGCYFAFISVTTVGFGDIVPRNSNFVIPTMIYIFVGLSLTTLAVEVLAAGFRRIHYVGRPIAGARSAKLWFGSKLFTINDLVRSVGRELGVSEDQVMRLNANIDLVLEEAAEEIEQSGRIDMPLVHQRSRTSSISKSKSPPQLDDPLSVRVDSPRFSGQYDNIPETWGNGLDVPFADHDETRQKLLS